MPEPVLDAEEYQRIEESKQARLEQERLRTRSEVLNKQLPRLGHIPERVYFYKRNPILSLIEEEYISLIYSDAVDYPQEGMEFPSREIRYREKIEQELLEEAKALVCAESQLQPNTFTADSGHHEKVQLVAESRTVRVQSHETLDDLRVQYQASVAHYVSMR